MQLPVQVLRGELGQSAVNLLHRAGRLRSEQGQVIVKLKW